MHLIISVPLPQILEQIAEVMKVIQQEQISKRIVEQIVDVPVPQIPEQIVEVPVPQVMEETVETTTHSRRDCGCARAAGGFDSPSGCF